MTKITQRKVDKSFEIYLALYQAITGNEEQKKILRTINKIISKKIQFFIDFQFCTLYIISPV